jgi:hypothetical protein
MKKKVGGSSKEREEKGRESKEKRQKKVDSL